MKRKLEAHTLAVIVAVHVAAFGGWWWMGSSWIAWTGFAVAYAIALVGVSVGYHRYFTHQSFSCSPRFEKFLAACGAMACQTTLEKWVFWHNLHHRWADEPGDPHRPEEFRAPPGSSRWKRMYGWCKGFAWSHCGWTWYQVARPPGWEKFMRHASDAIVLWQKKWYWWMVVLNYAIPTLIAAGYGLAVGGWHGAWTKGLQGLFIGGFFRQVWSWHATWSVNSIGHLFGHRPRKATKDTGNKSRNNAGVVAMAPIGEGWHFWHHLQPNCARLGWAWYQIDFGWYFICFSEWRGWVWDVNRPTPANLAFL